MPEDSQDAAATGEGEAQDTGTSATPGPAGEAELQALVDKLTAEKNDLTDLLLRKQAELENFRKRTQREREEFLQHATADLIYALLPTLDAFDRALAHRTEGAPEQFYQGLELIHKELLEALGRAGLTSFETVGRDFDPHLHHAVEMVETDEHRDHEILEEMQRGYRLKKRLLRPAIVKVAVAKAKSGHTE
ncbi:MAG: nucleotide exchange factor GrpE [Acidobacteria bacterium]|nr:nucleotide exchange factor GrpE [Acidobacteriota bacterium]